jgi:hypothetical protein
MIYKIESMYLKVCALHLCPLGIEILDIAPNELCKFSSPQIRLTTCFCSIAQWFTKSSKLSLLAYENNENVPFLE